jgi:hypothetical protein
MEYLLLSVHVMAGIVFVGGSAVATSLFPRYVPVLVGVPAARSTRPSETPQASGERNRAVAVALHRITRGYSAFGLIVPAVGIVLAFMQGRSGEIWIIVSMVLTAAAGVLLAPGRDPECVPCGSRPALRPSP